MSKTILQLPAAAAAATTQLLEVVTDPAGSPVSQRLSIAQLITLLDTRYAQFTVAVNRGGTGVTTFGGTNRLLYTTATDVLSSIVTANTSALVTSNAGVPSWVSGGTANRVLRTDGTTVSFAQVALATDASGTLAATNGGTGTATVTTGDILYGSAANVWSKLADVATGNALISGGIGVIPGWGKIGLTTHVSGTLAVGNGGTGVTSLLLNSVVYGNNTSGLQTSSNLTFDGTLMVVNGTMRAAHSEAVLDFIMGDSTTWQAGGTKITQDGNTGGALLEMGGSGNTDGVLGRILYHSFDSSAIAGWFDGIDAGGAGAFKMKWYNGDPAGTFNLLMELTNTGDLNIPGKLTAPGGIDPPYMLLDLQTRENIQGYSQKISQPKKTGAMMFFNALNSKLELYVPASNKFFNLDGTPAAP